MAYIRTFAYYIVFALSLFFWSLAVLIILPLVSKNCFYRCCINWLLFVRNYCLPILAIKLNTHGLENIPSATEPAAVFLIKHQTQLETFIVPTYFKTKFAYVFKKEIFKLPFLGWVLRRMEMLPIDRRKRSQAFHFILTKGTELLNKGTAVAIYPEGTRIPRGQSGNYKVGGAALAVHAKAKVIPVAVTSAKCWGQSWLKKQAGSIDISFGPALESHDLTANQLLDQATSWIEQEMRRLDPEAYTD